MEPKNTFSFRRRFLTPQSSSSSDVRWARIPRGNKNCLIIYTPIIIWQGEPGSLRDFQKLSRLIGRLWNVLLVWRLAPRLANQPTANRTAVPAAEWEGKKDLLLRPWEAPFFLGGNIGNAARYVNLVDFSRISMLDFLEGRTLISITVPYGISFDSLTCLPCNLIPSLCRLQMCHSMRNSSSLGEFQVISSSPLSSLHLTRIHTWLIQHTVIRTIYVGLCMYFSWSQQPLIQYFIPSYVIFIAYHYIQYPAVLGILLTALMIQKNCHFIPLIRAP